MLDDRLSSVELILSLPSVSGIGRGERKGEIFSATFILGWQATLFFILLFPLTLSGIHEEILAITSSSSSSSSSSPSSLSSSLLLCTHYVYYFISELTERYEGKELASSSLKVEWNGKQAMKAEQYVDRILCKNGNKKMDLQGDAGFLFFSVSISTCSPPKF